MVAGAAASSSTATSPRCAILTGMAYGGTQRTTRALRRSLRAPFALLAAALLTGCDGCDGCDGGSPNRPAVALVPPMPPLPSTAPIDPIDGVLAHIQGSQVCLARATAERIEPLTCTETARALALVRWRNARELVALTREGEVVLLEGAKVTPVKSPPEGTWKAKKPAEFDAKYLQPPSMDEPRLLVEASGDVWMGRCAWTFILDKPACVRWVYARLLPSLEVRSEAPLAAPPYDSPDAGNPSELTLTVPDRDAEDRDAEGGRAAHMVCARRGREPVMLEIPDANPSANASVEVRAWLAPELYIARVTLDFLETEVATSYLMRGCEAKPLMVLGAGDGDEEPMIWGPAGLWAHPSKEGWTVRHFDRVLGHLESAPVFRPPDA
jgi:hypothetical protein